MNIIIERQFNELGGEYLNQDKIQMDIRKYKDEIIIETDGNLYAIPISILKGVIEGLYGDNDSGLIINFKK